jgi:methionine sulfoxide reductase heme-binding subunit
MTSHFVWITCRAAGTAALVLSSAAVGMGVLMSGRAAKGRGLELRVAHEALSFAVFALIALHVVALLDDSYFHPSIADLAIPFERDYREPYMAIGILGGWGTIVFGFSFYVRGRIGYARWKILHRFTALTWALGVVHALGEGTDGGEAWFIAVVAVTALPTVVLILVRLGDRRRPRARVELAARYLSRVRGIGW